MQFADVITTVIGALLGALAGFITTSHLNSKAQRAAEDFARKNRSVDLNLEMHKEFVSLMGARIAVWNAFRNKQVRSDDPQYSDLWLIGNFYIRLAYLMDAGLLSPSEIGDLHGQNAWWWSLHYFANDRTALLNEQGEVKQVARAWQLIKDANPDKVSAWEHAAGSYD